MQAMHDQIANVVGGAQCMHSRSSLQSQACQTMAASLAKISAPCTLNYKPLTTRWCPQILKERKQQQKRQQRGKPGAKGKSGRGRPDAREDAGGQSQGHGRSTKKGFMGSKAAGKSASKGSRMAKGRR